MNNKINLSRLKKCDQVWDEMEETDCGRLCQQCNKTIIDFRPLSDEEVARIHMFKTEAVCGVYRPDQFKAPVPQPTKVRNAVWSSLSFTLLSLLFTKTVRRK